MRAGTAQQHRREPDDDVPSARQLANDDRYQRQWRALSLVKVRPLGAAPSPASGEGRGGGRSEGKKGADRGIDGVIIFVDEAGGKARHVLVPVKSGNVKSGDDHRRQIHRMKAEG
jgi:hypothetical protein